MRTIVSNLSALFLAALLLFASVAAPLAQDRSETDPRREAYREWQSIANGRTDFDLSDPALVPSRLALAAAQSGCRYKDAIEELPVRFIRIEKRRLALVFCYFGIMRSHQLFDLSDLTKPKLLEFPHLAQPEGFGTTSRPGVIAWKQESGLFEAEQGSDLCGSPGIRHTYRFDGYSFVVIRIEVKPDSCAQGGWTTMWDAPRWSLSGQPSAH
jgi:hypothetical protein